MVTLVSVFSSTKEVFEFLQRLDAIVGLLTAAIALSIYVIRKRLILKSATKSISPTTVKNAVRKFGIPEIYLRRIFQDQVNWLKMKNRSGFDAVISISRKRELLNLSTSLYLEQTYDKVYEVDLDDLNNQNWIDKVIYAIANKLRFDLRKSLFLKVARGILEDEDKLTQKDIQYSELLDLLDEDLSKNNRCVFIKNVDFIIQNSPEELEFFSVHVKNTMLSTCDFLATEVFPEKHKILGNDIQLFALFEVRNKFPWIMLDELKNDQVFPENQSDWIRYWFLILLQPNVSRLYELDLIEDKSYRKTLSRDYFINNGFSGETVLGDKLRDHFSKKLRGLTNKEQQLLSLLANLPFSIRQLEFEQICRLLSINPEQTRSRLLRTGLLNLTNPCSYIDFSGDFTFLRFVSSDIFQAFYGVDSPYTHSVVIRDAMRFPSYLEDFVYHSLMDYEGYFVRNSMIPFLKGVRTGLIQKVRYMFEKLLEESDKDWINIVRYKLFVVHLISEENPTSNGELISKIQVEIDEIHLDHPKYSIEDIGPKSELLKLLKLPSIGAYMPLHDLRLVQNFTLDISLGNSKYVITYSPGKDSEGIEELKRWLDS